MANFYTENEDLRFYVEREIDWAPLTQLIEDDFTQEDGFENSDETVSFYEDVLDLVGKFSADEIDPYVADLDKMHPHLVDGIVQSPQRFNDILQQIADLGLHGLALPREFGGMNSALITYMMATELFSRSDVALSSHIGFHAGIAMALVVYAYEEGAFETNEKGMLKSLRFQEEIEEILKGKAWGSMDITEPDAGSDMANLRTKAEQDEEGNWLVSGQKIFITSGHGKYHVVIAKTDDRNSLDALSLFLVKAFEEDEKGNRTIFASVDRLEEKLGHHISATCSITYSKTPAQLIGKVGEGFRQMLLLMNNARISVGFECLGICESALRKTKRYADERRTFGKSIDKHEMIADYIDEMETDVRAMRALSMHAAYAEERSYRSKIYLKKHNAIDQKRKEAIEADVKKYARTSRRLTPLLKYFAAEKSVEIARRAIQIHGGSGFTTEYGVEKLLRDAMVMPIYEGTSQIQALMAMKDTLGRIFKNPQLFVKKLAQARFRALSLRDPREKAMAKIHLYSLQAQQHLIQKTAIDKFKNFRQLPITSWLENLTGQSWDPKKDFAPAMLHAEHLIKILIDEAVCEIFYEQGLKHEDRMEHFDKYIERAEPRCRYELDLIQTTGARLLSQLSTQVEAAAE